MLGITTIQGVAIAEEAVRGFIDKAFLDPGSFIAAGPVQEVKHRISPLVFIVVFRKVHEHAAAGGPRHTAVVEHLLYNALLRISCFLGRSCMI